jgi:hypothetical protein
VTVTLEDNIAALLTRIILCFQRERLPYVLIGAWALAAWGRPRSTNDLDFLQKLKVGRPRDFEDAVSVLEQLKDKLDRRYLEHWARKLGVTEELSYILAETD